MNDSQSHDNSKEISLVMVALEYYGATVTLSNEAKVIYVNGAKVLLRNQRTRSDNTCIELYHEGNRNVWCRSWGLTSDATWLLVVAHDDQHRWYNLASLRLQTRDGLTEGTINLVNNSYVTRNFNGPSSNVMNVWVPKSNAYLPNMYTYRSFLAGVS